LVPHHLERLCHVLWVPLRRLKTQMANGLTTISVTEPLMSMVWATSG
jgi:hypothetical protein